MQSTAAIGQDPRRQIIDFMSGFTLETTPGSAARTPDYRAHARAGAIIYVTSLLGANFNNTIAVARRLRSEGFNPVPHLAARRIASKRSLDETLARLTGEIGVSRVLCIAGADSAPVGEFSDTRQLLETGLFDKYAISHIGLAGHPEGSRDIAAEAIGQALKWKNEFSRRTDAELYLTTQFCFEAAPIIAWDQRLLAEGNRLPVHIGIPGLATVGTLLNHAKACGVGPSMRFLSRQAMNVARLMSVSAPDKLVTELAAYKAGNANCGIRGVHMYPLGSLKKTADWAYAVADGKFRMKPGGQGFEVEVPQV